MTLDKLDESNTSTQSQQLRSMRYDSVFSLLLIASAMGSVLLVQADTLIGAVGLRFFYTGLGIVMPICFLFASLSLLAWYKDIPIWLAFGLGLVLCGGIVILNLLLAWIVASVVAIIPVGFILLGLGMVWVVWVWANFRFTPTKRKIMRIVSAALALFTAFYIFGIAFLPGHSELNFRGSKAFNNRYYYLIIYWGWLGDPDNLILYECNQFALNCAKVYTTSGEYRATNVELVPEPDNNNLLVRVDGNTLYTYRSSQ